MHYLILGLMIVGIGTLALEIYDLGALITSIATMALVKNTRMEDLI